MRVDLRVHPGIREQVRAGVLALIVQARQIIGVEPKKTGASREVKAHLGHMILMSLHEIGDLGLDPLECLELAIEEQEALVKKNGEHE